MRTIKRARGGAGGREHAKGRLSFGPVRRGREIKSGRRILKPAWER